MTRQQIIEALKICMGGECESDCPYFEADETEFFCSQQLKRDAMVMLMEDEGMEDDHK